MNAWEELTEAEQTWPKYYLSSQHHSSEVNIIRPRFGERGHTREPFKDSENQGYSCNSMLFCVLAKSAVSHKVCEICDKNMWKSICTEQRLICPVTLLYSICRTLYVTVWRQFFYYLLIIFVNLLLAWPNYPICLFCPKLMMMMCNVTEGNICIGIKDYIMTYPWLYFDKKMTQLKVKYLYS